MPERESRFMPRYIQDFRLQEPAERSFADIHQYMTAHGFQYTNLDGETVFKKGKGWFMAPQVIKVTYGPDKVRLEGWIRYAILPGVYGSELGRGGFVGCAGKGPMKKAFDWIAVRLGGNYTALCPGRDTEPSKMPPIQVPIEQLTGQNR